MSEKDLNIHWEEIWKYDLLNEEWDRQIKEKEVKEWVKVDVSHIVNPDEVKEFIEGLDKRIEEL